MSASPERARSLVELGADYILTTLEPDGPEFDAIIEGVGGASLGAALQCVSAFGTVVSFAASDQTPAQFPAMAFYSRAPAPACMGSAYSTRSGVSAPARVTSRGWSS